MSVCVGSGQQHVAGRTSVQGWRSLLGLKRQSIVILVVPLLYTRHFRLTACNFSNNHVMWVLWSPSYRTRSWNRVFFCLKSDRWWSWDSNWVHSFWFGELFEWQSLGTLSEWPERVNRKALTSPLGSLNKGFTSFCSYIICLCLGLMLAVLGTK